MSGISEKNCWIFNDISGKKAVIEKRLMRKCVPFTERLLYQKPEDNLLDFVLKICMSNMHLILVYR